MKPPSVPCRVLIVPDKFKGTLTATEAAAHIRRGWLQARSDDQVRCLPLTDGGDGFGDCLRRILKAPSRRTSCLDAAHRVCVTPWWLTSDGRTAVVESALCIGLAMLPTGAFHPYELDTEGLARLLIAVSRSGARQCLVGIGGSATNDGGFGLARGLGWQFLDRRGRLVERWTGLVDVASIRPPATRALGRMNVLVATDVQNKLLGSQGATRVYGPQKGLLPRQFARAEANLQQLRALSRQHSGRDLAQVAGSGAAGGLGFGLMAFADAQLESGFALYARYSQFQKTLHWAQLVVTGEGRLDRSSLMGKGVGEVARLTRKRRIPCVALGGRVADRSQLLPWFIALDAMAPHLAPTSEAIAHPGHYLTILSRQVAAGLTQNFVRPRRRLT